MNTDSFASPDQLEPVATDLPGDALMDHYSDRLWVDLPPMADLTDAEAECLGEGLVELAHETSPGRVVLFSPTALQPELEDAGFTSEALIPGYFRGHEDCSVMRLALDPTRAEFADPAAAERVDDAIHASPSRVFARPEVVTEPAERSDAVAIAELIGETFDAYPSPSNNPGYVAESMDKGVPYRVIRRDGDVVACACADLVPEARTAELTDCATRPDFRGRGFMQAILEDLMGDLVAMDYPTAFTLARARIAGVNKAFWRLGFGFRGRLSSSVRIGTGIEDMNVWSRFLNPRESATTAA